MVIRSIYPSGNASSIYRTARSNNVSNSPSPGGPDDEINALMQQTQLPPTPPQSNNSNNNLVAPTLNNQDTKGNGNFVTQLWDKAKSFVDKLPNAVKIGGAVLGTALVGYATYKGLKGGVNHFFQGNSPLGSSELRQSKRNLQSLRTELKEANEEHKALKAAHPNTDYHWTDWFNPFWTDKGRKFIDAKAARKTIEQNKEQLKKTSEKYHKAYWTNKVLATGAMIEKRKKEVEIYKQKLKEAKAALEPIIKNGKEPKNDHAQLALSVTENQFKIREARLEEALKIHQAAKRENNNGFDPSEISVSAKGLTWKGVFADDTELKTDVKNNTWNSKHKLTNTVVSGLTEDIASILSVTRPAKPNWFEKWLDNTGLKKYKSWTKPLEVRPAT